MAWAEIKRDGSRNLAGLFWWLADPLVNLVIYYIVFTRVFRPTTSNFLAFLFLNLMVWRWLSVTIMQSSSSIATSTGLLRQIYLPKAVLPLKFLLTESMAFGIGMVLVAVTLVIDHVPIHRSMALLPFLILLTVAHIYSLSLILALVAPYVPDSTQVLNFVLRGLAMMSGVFFDPSVLGSRLETIIYMNPWASLLDAYRAVLLRGDAPDLGKVAYVVILTVLLAACGRSLHRRLDRRITKVLR